MFLTRQVLRVMRGICSEFTIFQKDCAPAFKEFERNSLLEWKTPGLLGRGLFRDSLALKLLVLRLIQVTYTKKKLFSALIIFRVLIRNFLSIDRWKLEHCYFVRLRPGLGFVLGTSDVHYRMWLEIMKYCANVLRSPAMKESLKPIRICLTKLWMNIERHAFWVTVFLVVCIGLTYCLFTCPEQFAWHTHTSHEYMNNCLPAHLSLNIYEVRTRAAICRGTRHFRQAWWCAIYRWHHLRLTCQLHVESYRTCIDLLSLDDVPRTLENFYLPVCCLKKRKWYTGLVEAILERYKQLNLALFGACVVARICRKS